MAAGNKVDPDRLDYVNPLDITQGGTNAITAAAARTNLGAAASGANQDITSLVESGSTISVNPVLKRLLSGGTNNLDWASKFLSNGWFANTGDFSVGTVGFGFNVKEGTNARQGVATLVAGTVTVSTTKALTNSRIFLTIQAPNAGTPSFVYVSARTNATSFVITSGLATDTSDVAWEIFNPSA